MALMATYKCVCFHSFLDHCGEDEEGLFFIDCKVTYKDAEGKISPCRCVKYEPSQNVDDIEVIELFMNGVMQNIKRNPPFDPEYEDY